MAEPKDKRTTDTRERILDASLRLFARQGFKATSVAQIADAVGVSAPSLYKHFKGKGDIFEELMSLCMRGYDTHMNVLRIDFLPTEQEREQFIGYSEERQIRHLQNRFRYALEDEAPGLFRRLLAIEQFNMPELARKYNDRYVNRQIDSIEKLMQLSIERGVMADGDPRTMAIQYISPILLYIEICDREPFRKKEALEAIETHVCHFNWAYRLT